MDKLYLEDIEEIIAHRYDNGADYWTTEDRKLLKGAPFTTLESPMYLLELGVSGCDPNRNSGADFQHLERRWSFQNFPIWWAVSLPYGVSPKEPVCSRLCGRSTAS